MTELQLYKFVHDYNVEWHWYDNDGDRDVMLLPSLYVVQEFNDLFSDAALDEDGVECVMKKGYFAFWMRDICEYHGINMVEVFGEDPGN